jgi:hypothetical protein
MKYADMTEALKQVRESTCPKCEGEGCECSEPTLEEQKNQLEEEIKILSDIKDTMIQEKIQQGFAVRFFDPSNGKRFAAAYPNKKDAEDKAAQLKKDGLKDISITQHTLNFKEENNEII